MFVRSSTYNAVVESHNEITKRNFELEKALRDILATQTEKPNATVQRMLRTAAKALRQPIQIRTDYALQVIDENGALLMSIGNEA